MEWIKFEGLDKIKINKGNYGVILLKSKDGDGRYLNHLTFDHGKWRVYPLIKEENILAYTEIDDITCCMCKNGEVDGISKDFFGEAFVFWGDDARIEEATVRLCSFRNGRFLWTALNIHEVAPPYIVGYQILPDIYSFKES
jgi:hypothetical protein